jgi:hypothetical protein
LASTIKVDTIQSTTSNVFVLNSVGTEYARFNSSGNLGIGISSPSFPLTVLSPSISSVAIAVNGRSSDNSGVLAFYANDGSTQYATITATAAEFRLSSVPAAAVQTFFTNSSERMRITSGGELFVGTTSNFSADKLCLNFTSLQNGIGIRDDSNSSGANQLVFRNSANGVMGTISRVTTTNAVAYNTTSDRRLKSNIADASPVLNKLMTVKVRQFDWTEGNLHQDAGFIAQELAPILSGIVTEGRTEDDWWQLDYAKLTPYLVKSIQEQQALITQLQADVAALKA